MCLFWKTTAGITQRWLSAAKAASAGIMTALESVPNGCIPSSGKKMTQSPKQICHFGDTFANQRDSACRGRKLLCQAEISEMLVCAELAWSAWPDGMYSPRISGTRNIVQKHETGQECEPPQIVIPRYGFARGQRVSPSCSRPAQASLLPDCLDAPRDGNSQIFPSLVTDIWVGHRIIAIYVGYQTDVNMRLLTCLLAQPSVFSRGLLYMA